MAAARGVRGTTTHPTSQAAPSKETLSALGDTFAKVALGFFQNSELAKDLSQMQEEWIEETAQMFDEWTEKKQYPPTRSILRQQLQKLHGYVYVNPTTTVS